MDEFISPLFKKFLSDWQGVSQTYPEMCTQSGPGCLCRINMEMLQFICLKSGLGNSTPVLCPEASQACNDRKWESVNTQGTSESSDSVYTG